MNIIVFNLCMSHMWKIRGPNACERHLSFSTMNMLSYCKLPLIKVSTRCLEFKNKKRSGPHLVLFSTQLCLHVHQARAWPYLAFLVVNGGSKPQWLPHLASVDVAKWRRTYICFETTPVSMLSKHTWVWLLRMISTRNVADDRCYAPVVWLWLGQLF